MERDRPNVNWQQQQFIYNTNDSRNAMCDQFCELCCSRVSPTSIHLSTQLNAKLTLHLSNSPRELNAQQCAVDCGVVPMTKTKIQSPPNHNKLFDMVVGQQEKTNVFCLSHSAPIYSSISLPSRPPRDHKNISSSIANISLWKCKCYHSWDVRGDKFRSRSPRFCHSTSKVQASSHLKAWIESIVIHMWTAD